MPDILSHVTWRNRQSARYARFALEEKHHHGGLGLHTAADVHYGRAAAVRAGRAQVLDAAYHAHPERFVRKPPAPPKLPGTSWINPPENKETGTQ